VLVSLLVECEEWPRGAALEEEFLSLLNVLKENSLLLLELFHSIKLFLPINFSLSRFLFCFFLSLLLGFSLSLRSSSEFLLQSCDLLSTLFFVCATKVDKSFLKFIK